MNMSNQSKSLLELLIDPEFQNDPNVVQSFEDIPLLIEKLRLKHTMEANETANALESWRLYILDKMESEYWVPQGEEIDRSES